MLRSRLKVFGLNVLEHEPRVPPPSTGVAFEGDADPASGPLAQGCP